MHHADYRDPASSGRARRNQWARSGTCSYGDHRGASVQSVPQGAFVRPCIKGVIGEPVFQVIWPVHLLYLIATSIFRSPSPSSATTSTAPATDRLDTSPPPPPSSATTSEDVCNAFEGSVKRFTWDEVRQMTDGLTSKKLGEGGFGTVYLGKLPNPKKVAVKVLHDAKQGMPEFVNEVKLVEGLNHENLVRLLGYCQDHKKVLVFEYAEEGTLWDHLHGGRSRLSWKQRLDIALQAARGLEYLHNGCNPTILHRDIKSENILLARGLIAKIADFGISKVGSDQDHIRMTHVSTRVIGTRGYLDPEYHMTGRFSNKSDVYSFGVLLFEIVTGRKPIVDIILITDWVKEHKGRVAADPYFKGQFNAKALKLVLSVANQCTQPRSADRPGMNKVVRALEDAQIAEDENKKSWWWGKT